MIFVMSIWAVALSGTVSLEQETVPRSVVDSTQAAVTFKQDIAPLLKTNCSPCHFEGGQVVDKYPFAEYNTVKKLGEKLNTRLKEQEQQTLVLDWLKSGARESSETRKK